MDDYRLMEVSGSAAAANESIDNMGKEKEKEEEKDSSAFQKNKRKRGDIRGSERESDDDDGSEPEEEEEEEEVEEWEWEEEDEDEDEDEDEEEEEEEVEDKEKEKEDCGQYPEEEDEEEEEEEEDPIRNLIINDDKDSLLQCLKISKDGNHNHCLLKYAFQLACRLNKLGCLKALLDSGVDWFAEYPGSEERLLQPTCVADSKDAAQLLIDYAKERDVLPKLLGAAGGKTPLHVAAICGSWNVVKLLLAEGADPCKQDAHHKLPCDVAFPGSKAQKLLMDAVLIRARRGFI